MQVREIQQFSENRTKARAYLCYLFARNIPNFIPNQTYEGVLAGLKKIKKEINEFDALYVLDKSGVQVDANISNNPEYRTGKGQNRSLRAYYYRSAREKKCILTDPYPSLLTSELTVTAAYPIYDENHKLCFIACIDISLSKINKIATPTTLDHFFNKTSAIVYGTFSAALFAVAILLFISGIKSILLHGMDMLQNDIKEMFEATILLTLSLAIFDLVKTIFEEEVLGRYKKEDNGGAHKTMVRFLGSIIIALAIEALMLVFKFAITGPDKIVYAVVLLAGVTFLLIGLAFYMKTTSKNTQRASRDSNN